MSYLQSNFIRAGLRPSSAAAASRLILGARSRGEEYEIERTRSAITVYTESGRDHVFPRTSTLTGGVI